MRRHREITARGRIVGAVALVCLVTATLASVTRFALAAGSGDPGDEKKVWVCKYVGKPGVDERLKEGKNPIEVSIDAVGAVGSVFPDAQGRSYVIAISHGEAEGPQCPATPPGETTTEPTEPGDTETPCATETPTETPTETEGPTESPTQPETEDPAETTTGPATPGETATDPATPTGIATTDPSDPTATDGTAEPTSTTDDSASPQPPTSTGSSCPTGSAAGLKNTAPAGADAALGRVPASTVEIPAVGIQAPIGIAAVVDGLLEPPADAAAVGLWAGGAVPGSASGRSVLVGHSLRQGDGAFDEIGSLRKGAKIFLHRTDGPTLRYRVASVRVLTDAEFAHRSARILGSGGRPGLLLLTCTGWDGTEYRGNVVVTAHPTAGG
ncbi:class F sortase [Nocardioides sp. GXZ039]|uniref:class F sortase n=1 Tax=Nocardioides sp. GXZ039 TaxID=3136018 RepID=UPI0030F3B60A